MYFYDCLVYVNRIVLGLTPTEMEELENRTTEDLQMELEELEEKYIRQFTSQFDKQILSKIWEKIRVLKMHLRERDEKNKIG